MLRNSRIGGDGLGCHQKWGKYPINPAGIDPKRACDFDQDRERARVRRGWIEAGERFISILCWTGEDDRQRKHVPPEGNRPVMVGLEDVVAGFPFRCKITAKDCESG